MNAKLIYRILIIIILGIVLFFIFGRDNFDLPKGETVPFSEDEIFIDDQDDIISDDKNKSETNKSENNQISIMKSTREIFVTDGVKHSIPINEILSGGPPKDGIPSIDNPKFITVSEADGFLDSGSPGLGLSYKDETRFYPYQILVWHEIVNDIVAGDPLLITYCPLCLTGIVFDRTIDGKATEFGVSGRLWKSNLLMFNRADNEENESLWSQVLGEAVLGENTGTKLVIVRSDAVLYGDWKEKHPETKVLSKDTGIARSYGRDPYGNYYTDNSAVSFGATFNDTRLESKDFVLGIEINGKFKAYNADSLKVGTTDDTFEGKKITIEKSEINEVKMFIGENKEELSYIGGFWFSWLAVHPNTELYK